MIADDHIRTRRCRTSDLVKHNCRHCDPKWNSKLFFWIKKKGIHQYIDLLSEVGKKKKIYLDHRVKQGSCHTLLVGQSKLCNEQWPSWEYQVDAQDREPHSWEFEGPVCHWRFTEVEQKNCRACWQRSNAWTFRWGLKKKMWKEYQNTDRRAKRAVRGPPSLQKIHCIQYQRRTLARDGRQSALEKIGGNFDNISMRAVIILKVNKWSYRTLYIDHTWIQYNHDWKQHQVVNATSITAPSRPWARVQREILIKGGGVKTE